MIYTRRSTYKHESRGEMEKTTNLGSWEEIKEILEKESPESLVLFSQASLVLVVNSIKHLVFDLQPKSRIVQHLRKRIEGVFWGEEEEGDEEDTFTSFLNKEKGVLQITQ
jgi:hypothetical protein